MTGEWLAYCQACPVPEIANVVSRCRIPFFQVTGMLENDPVAWAEIGEWIEAARVAHIMEHNRLGVMGNYYGGMLDIYSDFAIWELMAKIVSLPLYKLLGGSVSEVPAYASGGYYQDGKDIPGLAREIQVYRSRGFTSFKIKVGHMTPELEEERVAAALDAAGPQGKIAIDANNAWKSVAEAWPYVCRFEKFNLWWLEEPFSPDNRPAYRELAKRTRIPLASGELESGRDSFRDYIEHGSAQILQTDATVVGGITEWRRVAAMAEGWNLPMAPHWVPDVHAHLLASIPNGWTAEYFLPEAGILNFEQLLENPLHVNNGIIRLDDEPGHGIRVNTDAVQTFLKAGAPPKLSSVGVR